MVRMESLRSLMATRLPQLACVRLFSDVAPDDPLRVKLYEKCELRLLWVEGVQRAQQVVATLEEAAAKAARETGKVGPPAELLQQAREVLKAQKQKLDNAQSTARHATLETKRFEMYQQHLRVMDVPDEVKRSRCAVRIQLY